MYFAYLNSRKGGHPSDTIASDGSYKVPNKYNKGGVLNLDMEYYAEEIAQSYINKIEL